jgi:hypothetical protein
MKMKIKIIIIKKNKIKEILNLILYNNNIKYFIYINYKKITNYNNK